jgi:glycosyltransferase involved in cell wall biosynthesis
MRAFDVNKRLSQKSPVIVMVANGWGKIKNAQAGLQAFAQLRSNYPAARLRLFGEDFGRGGSADLWANKNEVAQGVEFIGPMPYADVLEEIAQADILLHPSLEESFGMVIAEAMALGIPVIGGKASGAVPWVIGDGGLVVEACDPANLAKALNSLLSSPETWHRLRNTAYMASLSRFSPDLIAAAYEDVYREQILDAGRKRDWPRGVKV